MNKMILLLSYSFPPEEDEEETHKQRWKVEQLKNNFLKKKKKRNVKNERRMDYPVSEVWMSFKHLLENIRR